MINNNLFLRIVQSKWRRIKLLLASQMKIFALHALFCKYFHIGSMRNCDCYLFHQCLMYEFSLSLAAEWARRSCFYFRSSSRLAGKWSSETYLECSSGAVWKRLRERCRRWTAGRWLVIWSPAACTPGESLEIWWSLQEAVVLCSHKITARAANVPHFSTYRNPLELEYLVSISFMCSLLNRVRRCGGLDTNHREIMIFSTWYC